MLGAGSVPLQPESHLGKVEMTREKQVRAKLKTRI